MGTISTAIPAPEYEPLLEAIRVAADIGERLPPMGDVSGVGGFALAVLARWAANVQAFDILRNAGLLTDAYGVARIASDLAILAAWVLHGGVGDDRFNTPEERVKALIDDANVSTRVCGVHSGRAYSTDLAGRSGVDYATLGCIRTTDAATGAMLRLLQQGDPVTTLRVWR